MISVTKKGLIKRTKVSDYEVSRNNKTMSNMKLLEGDEVIGTYVAYDGDEILLASRNGFVTRYPISLIPITSPRSKGVKAMNLVNDDIASAIVHREAGNQLVVFSDTLAMKRLKLSEIDITGRPVKGNMICKKVKSKPYQIAYIGIYDINDEIIISNDAYHRFFAKDISLMSKDATFSTPFKHTGDFYVMKPLEKLQQVEMTSDDLSDEETEDFEEVSLFE